jgi:hypothetical protein
MKLILTINHLLSITVFLRISSYLQRTTEDMRAEYGTIVFNHVWSISNYIKEESLNIDHVIIFSEGNEVNDQITRVKTVHDVNK